MSLARKLKRKGLNKTSCCGGQMVYKEGYGVYVCLRCGKERRATQVGAEESR